MNPATTSMRATLRGPAIQGKYWSVLSHRKLRLCAERGRLRSDGRPIGRRRQKSARKAVGLRGRSVFKAAACSLEFLGTGKDGGVLQAVRRAGEGRTRSSTAYVSTANATAKRALSTTATVFEAVEGAAEESYASTRAKGYRAKGDPLQKGNKNKAWQRELWLSRKFREQYADIGESGPPVGGLLARICVPGGLF